MKYASNGWSWGVKLFYAAGQPNAGGLAVETRHVDLLGKYMEIEAGKSRPDIGRIEVADLRQPGSPWVTVYDELHRELALANEICMFLKSSAPIAEYVKKMATELETLLAAPIFDAQGAGEFARRWYQELYGCHQVEVEDRHFFLSVRIIGERLADVHGAAVKARSET
jgi:hypothetical protein